MAAKNMRVSAIFAKDVTSNVSGLGASNINPRFLILSKASRSVFFTIPILIFSFSSSGQGLQVADTLSDQQLVELLVGGGLQISNVTVNCAPHGYGSFDGSNSNIGMVRGMILTSGDIDSARGPNDDSGITGDNGLPGDSALTIAAGDPTYDACILEFDLVPVYDTLKFNYVFGSEEYLEYVFAGFNDVFAFYISGPGIAGTRNIALVPGTSIPVAIDNVNDVVNSAYYIDNGDGFTAPYNGSPWYVQYDGFTTVLQARQVVIPCQTYHLRLAIADVGDHILDSGVFIEAESLVSAGVELGVGSSAGSGFPYAIEGCTDGIFTFMRNMTSTQAQTVHFVVAGTAINGNDYPLTADSIVIPAGQSSANLLISPVVDGAPEGVEYMVIYLADPCFGGYVDSAYLYFLDEMQVMASPDTTICAGDTAALWAAGGTVFSWLPASAVDSPAAAHVLAFPATTTAFTVQVTAGSCTETESVVVNVNPLPSVDAGLDVAVCVGDSTTLNATGAVTYVWTPPGGLSDPFGSNPGASPAVTTIYGVTGTGANGCQASDQVIVTVNPLPPVQALPDTAICPGTSAQLIASGAVTYLWAPASMVSDSTSAYTMTSPSTITIFTLTGTDGNGCANEDLLSLTVLPLPNVEAGTDTTIILGQIAFLNGITDGVSYAWSPAAGLSNAQILNPWASPEQTTTYVLTAITSAGCTSRDSVTVTVLDMALIAIPNAFSPNGDGLNDFLWVKSYGSVDVEYFRIFNRWGELVFEDLSNDILDSQTNGWDGSTQGRTQPMGVYAFIFKGVTPAGETIMHSGNITLLR